MTPSTLSNVWRRVVRASLAVVLAQALFKLASLLQAVVMAPWIDRSFYDVAYAFAFEGVVFTFCVVADQVIAPSFLPLFMRRKDQRGEAEAWQFARVVLTWQTLLLGVCAAGIMTAPGAVIRLLTAWRPETHPETWALAQKSLQWLALSLIGLSLGTTTYMILNAYKRFFLAAFGDAVWKFCVVFCVLIGMGALRLDHRVLYAGLLIGSAAKLATHLFGLRDQRRWWRPAWIFGDAAGREMLCLMAPLILGVLFAKVRDVFNNVTILTHLDTPGLLMANSFGRKMINTVGWLVPYAVSVAIFPFFCEFLDQGDRSKFGDLLSRAVRLLLALFIPLAFLCVALSSPLTRLMFERGKFTGEMARWTAISMAGYALVLPAQAVEYLLMKAFFAQRRMVAITVAGVVFSSLSMLVSAVGVRIAGLREGAALAVIAAGFSGSRILKAAALMVLLRRHLPCFEPRSTASFLLRTTFVAALAAAAAWGIGEGIARVPVPGPTELRQGLQIGLGILAAGGVFWMGSRRLNLQEPSDLWRWLIQRLRRKPPAEDATVRPLSAAPRPDSGDSL